MIRKIILKYKESIWFIPSLFILGSIVLAFAATAVDRAFGEQLQSFLPGFAFTSVSLGRSILTVIATSLLTMTTITFSTIMVVLSIYSSQFSPRTLQNFVSDKLTQTVLGVFIAGFTFSIVSLLFMTEREPETVVLSAFFAILLSLVSIGYFIRFLQHITKSIQVNNLIEELSLEVIKTLDRKKKNILEFNKKGKVLSHVQEGIINTGKKDALEFSTEKFGHIQYIDTEGLINFAKRKDVIAETTVRVGDYIGKASPVLLIWNYGGEEELKCTVSKYMTIGNYKNTTWDIDFGLQKLEEVALRAISPSINDPNTAMLAVRNMGEILFEVCDYCSDKKYFYDQDQDLRLILNERSFEEVLYTSFYKILNFSRNQISVLSSVIEALTLIAEGKEKRNKDTLIDFCQYAANGFDQTILQKKDKEFINAKFQKIAMYLETEPEELFIL